MAFLEIKALADWSGLSLFSPVNSILCGFFVSLHCSKHLLSVLVVTDDWLSFNSPLMLLLRHGNHQREGTTHKSPVECVTNAAEKTKELVRFGLASGGKSQQWDLCTQLLPLAL